MVNAILPLELRGATVRKRNRNLVGPVDLTISGAGTTVVIGPNGSGKTILLRMMHGLERLSEGQVTWHADTQSVRSSQSFVFQTPIMLRRTVHENLIYPLVVRDLPRREAGRLASEWLDRIGLADMAKVEATSLSAGERQKLALARALVPEPHVLFLDEPTTNLDGRSTREIESILLEALNTGVRIVMATHDMGQARRLADEVLFLFNGRLHEQGGATSFFDGPSTKEARAFLKGEIVE